MLEERAAYEYREAKKSPSSSSGGLREGFEVVLEEDGREDDSDFYDRPDAREAWPFEE